MAYKILLQCIRFLSLIRAQCWVPKSCCWVVMSVSHLSCVQRRANNRWCSSSHVKRPAQSVPIAAQNK